MVPPERRSYPVLGLVAYALVPGERRLRAARHFRRAGIEGLKGVVALVTPEKRPEEGPSEREHIEIE